MLKEIAKKAAGAKLNVVDRAVSFFSPVSGARRLRARIALEVFGAYDGASKSKRSMKGWTTLALDADGDILPELENLRERSRDLVRNNPVAASAIKTKITNVIGTGLRYQSRIDREKLGLTDEEADAWEMTAEREWRLFWESKDTDIARTCNGHGLLKQIYQQQKENGDVFILLPRIERKGSVYDLKIQIVEADRVCNKDNEPDSDRLAGGIKRDDNGAPVEYHILKQHPGSINATQEWQTRKAFGEKTGLPNVIHFFQQTRPGQSRGVPDLAPVIEPLKQLGRYTEAEIMAAVVSGMFTVFIQTESGEGGFDYSNLGNETDQKTSDKDMKLGNGLIVELAENEKIETANPGRPNSNFDPFFVAIIKQVGAALEVPFEILIRHFNASYSAARAALLALWQYVLTERRFVEDNVLKPILEVWVYEAVTKGRLYAPGFLNDPAIRAAYLGCRFIGPSKGQINELAEVKAAKERIDANLSTLADETAELTGRDWEQNHRQQVKEYKKRKEDGLIKEPEPAQQSGGNNE